MQFSLNPVSMYCSLCGTLRLSVVEVQIIKNKWQVKLITGAKKKWMDQNSPASQLAHMDANKEILYTRLPQRKNHLKCSVTMSWQESSSASLLA